MKQLEFFYDLSSPWTYLAFNNVQPILESTGAPVIWRPFLVGGVFNAVNPDVYEARAEPMNPKVVHNFRWLHEWAELAGLPLTFPTVHHPVKSVLAMRACCVLEADQSALQRFSAAAFDAYFARGENIDDPAVLASVADGCDLDGEALIAKGQTKRSKISFAVTLKKLLLAARTGRRQCLLATRCTLATINYPLSGNNLKKTARDNHRLTQAES